MPRKTKTETNSEAPARAPRRTRTSAKEAPAREPAREEPATARKRASRKKQERSPTPEPEVVEEEERPPVKTKQARVVNRDTVMASLDEVVTQIDDELKRLREESSGKSPSARFLRALVKRMRTLRTDTGRVLKHRTRTNRPANNNSGFMKPVRVSTDMANFAGWDPSEMKSRVDVTKYICNYIKENDLQNPEDRREILPDDKLKKLLQRGKNDPPLTYYRLQQCIQPHFVKQEA